MTTGEPPMGVGWVGLMWEQPGVLARAAGTWEGVWGFSGDEGGGGGGGVCGKGVELRGWELGDGRGRGRGRLSGWGEGLLGRGGVGGDGGGVGVGWGRGLLGVVGEVGGRGLLGLVGCGGLDAEEEDV